MSNLVVVATIHSGGRIPFLKRWGPITYPINIPKDIADDLIQLGYDVRIREVYNPKTNESNFTGNTSTSANSNPAPNVFKSEVHKPLVSNIVKTTPIVVEESLPEDSILTEKQEVVEEGKVEETATEETSKVEEVKEETAPAATVLEEEPEEMKILTDAELEAMEAAELRNYLAQFEAILTKDEANTASHKNTTKKKLLDVAKAVTARLTNV